MFRLITTVLSSLFVAMLLLLAFVIMRSGFSALLSTVLHDSLFLSSILISLRTSVLAVVLTFLVGTPAAYFLTFSGFRGKKLCDTLIELPVVLPPLVLGLSLVILSGVKGPLGGRVEHFFPLLFTERGIVAAQFVVASPFYIRTVKQSMKRIPSNLLSASDILQASEAYRFFHLILPLSKGGIFAGLTLSWARAVGEFGATAMVAGSVPGKTETLTLMIYRFAASGRTEEALAGAMVLIVISMSVLAAVRWRSGHGTYS